MRLLPQSYRSQLHQGKEEEEEAGSKRRSRKRGGEPHARTQGDQDLNSGPTTACLPGSSLASCSFAPHSPGCSPSARPPLGRPGRDYYGCESGKRPIRRLFYSNYFSISALHSQFRGTHARKEEEDGHAQGGAGKGRDADVDHKTGWKRRMEWFGKRAKKSMMRSNDFPSLFPT